MPQTTQTATGSPPSNAGAHPSTASMAGVRAKAIESKESEFGRNPGREPVWYAQALGHSGASRQDARIGETVHAVIE
jgi:hypothetical protein